MRRLMLSVLALSGLLGAAACGTSVQIDSGFVILDTSPSGGAVNVDPRSSVRGLERRRRRSDASAIVLQDRSGAEVSATVTSSGRIRVISVQPADPLTHDARFTLTIGEALGSGDPRRQHREAVPNGTVTGCELMVYEQRATLSRPLIVFRR